MSHSRAFRKFRKLGATVVFATGLSAGAIALAASPHIVGEPTFTDLGNNLMVTAKAAGLGEVDFDVTFVAQGVPEVVCVNPSGKNEPPGQQPGVVDLTGNLTVSADDIEKNGTFTINLATAVLNVIPNAPDCRNDKWTERVNDVAFTSATITIEGGPTPTLTCVFSEPTDNEQVPRGDVRCF